MKNRQTIDGELQSTQTGNQDAPNSMEVNGINGVGSGIANLLTIAKLDKSKRSNYAKSKKSTLPKDFAKINPTRMDFLTFRAKQAFLQLRKTFTKGLILCHIDHEYYIYMSTNVLAYAIVKV